MRYIIFILFPIFICSCSSSSSQGFSKRDFLILKGTSLLSKNVSIISAYKEKDITTILKDENSNSKTIIHTKYMEPFEKCARYNTSYITRKNDSVEYLINKNFIFKICNKEKGIYTSELLSPNIPGLTGEKELIDINDIKMEEYTSG